MNSPDVAERKLIVDVVVSAAAAILIAVFVWLYSGSTDEGISAGLTTAIVGVSLATVMHVAMLWLHHREPAQQYRKGQSGPSGY
jgi:hypothetical protein